MYADARKIHLIEKVLAIKDERILTRLESIIVQSEKHIEDSLKTIENFSGIWDDDEAAEIEQILLNNF